MTHVRRLEGEGQINEAVALARDAANRFPAHYDWAGEIARLESEGKLARPYREGLEALSEGDADDALRLLSWVAGKNPRYQEVARYLFWARTGRDPEAAAEPEDAPPPSLLGGGANPLALPLTWGLALIFAILGFGLGWTISSSREAPVAEVPAAPAPPQPEPAVDAAPATAEAPVASPAAAPVAAPSVASPAEAPAPASTAPSTASATSGARSRITPGASGSSVSDVENPNLVSEADQLAINCQGGSPSACFKVGDSYYFGRGIARDLGAAVRYYTKACDLGEARGCYNAADMVEKGESVPKDKNKAKALFDKGCNLGDTQSCSRKSFLDVETTEVP